MRIKPVTPVTRRLQASPSRAMEVVMSNILLVCYSRTGNTRLVADELTQLTGWPLALIRDSKPRAGASGDWR